MNLDDLTFGQVREAARLFNATATSAPASTAIAEHAYPVGEAVFIRTVTMHYTGRLVRVTAGELVLTDAAWIADSGRFHTALAKGTLNEVEPYPDGEVIVSRDGVIDVSRWLHALPRDAK